MTTRRLAHLAMALALGGICCSSRNKERPAPEKVEPASQQSELVSTAPEPTAQPQEPRPPSDREKAITALDEGKYDTACEYLVASGLGKPLCDWILDTIDGGRDKPLSGKMLEQFLRSQHVRKLRGRIVGWYDQARNEYEIRAGGRLAVLVATETAFQTTGAFSMWAQELEKSDEPLASGRVVSVQVYREWPLFQAIYDAARARGPHAKASAVHLLDELVRGWQEDYCYRSDPASLECDGAHRKSESR